MPRILRDLKITEVSSVDKGAGEGVRILLMKRDFSQDQRDHLADTGAAMPDGSFPIKSRTDLKNAIQSAGRSSDPAKAKAHIRTRAEALGATDMLPDSWTKRDQENDMDTEALIASINKSVGDAITKAVAPLQDQINLLKMTDEHAGYHSSLDGDEAKKFSAMTHDERAAHMKAHPITAAKAKPTEGDNEPDGDEAATEKKMVQAFEKKLAPVLEEIGTLKKRNAELEEERAVQAFAKRASSIGLSPETDAVMLRKAYSGDNDAQVALEKRFLELTKQRDEALRAGGVFREFGTQKGQSGSAYDELMAKAEELRKANGNLSREQAFTKVLTDPANAEMATRHKREEQRNKFAVVA